MGGGLPGPVHWQPQLWWHCVNNLRRKALSAHSRSPSSGLFPSVTRTQAPLPPLLFLRTPASPPTSPVILSLQVCDPSTPERKLSHRPVSHCPWPVRTSAPPPSSATTALPVPGKRPLREPPPLGQQASQRLPESPCQWCRGQASGAGQSWIEPGPCRSPALRFLPQGLLLFFLPDAYALLVAAPCFSLAEPSSSALSCCRLSGAAPGHRLVQG